MTTDTELQTFIDASDDIGIQFKRFYLTDDAWTPITLQGTQVFAPYNKDPSFVRVMALYVLPVTANVISYFSLQQPNPPDVIDPTSYIVDYTPDINEKGQFAIPLRQLFLNKTMYFRVKHGTATLTKAYINDPI